MIDDTLRQSKQEQKEKVRRRMNVTVDKDNYEYFPAKKQLDYYDNDVLQRVAIYVRVSTDNVQQTTSYELQKKYYEDFVVRHPNWQLVKIYADEGISGTSLRHRDEFNQMIADCKAGKIDMIICKNVSRFARNVTDCIGIVRDLAALKSPVGVFFESECIFSLKDDSQMALSFLATMAEEESHTRSRSMETSLRMRLDNGIPLTPKLLGYSHDEDGNLIINPEEASTVKLAYFMLLYGYSTQQIATIFTKEKRRTYLGNTTWTGSGIVTTLRNERYCGDVLTRKTFTPNYRDHLSRKNRGERPQSRYYQHHEQIVSRDDFVAVQRLLDNSKYGNKGFLPELRVVEDGLLKGFVTINPRWAGFKEEDFFKACRSVYTDEDIDALSHVQEEFEVTVSPGDFDMRGFEVARTEFFEAARRPTVVFGDKKVKFGVEIVRTFAENSYVELMVNPIEMKFAVRPTTKENRNGVVFSKVMNGLHQPREIPSSAYLDTLFSIFDWKIDRKYRIIGTKYQDDKIPVYIFDAANSEVYLHATTFPVSEEDDESSHFRPLMPIGKRIKAIPAQWGTCFGKQFYVHELTLAALANQSEADWKLRLEGQLFESGRRLNVTGFEELQTFIRSELSEVPQCI